jgi:hypothetical protein
MRLSESQMERLGRVARRHDKRPSQMAAVLLEEALRMAEHPHIRFWETAAGRRAYLSGTRLSVWMVTWIVREYDGNLAAAAQHLREPKSRIQAALDYAATYPDEIDRLIEDNLAITFEDIKRMIPNATQSILTDEPLPEPDAAATA